MTVDTSHLLAMGAPQNSNKRTGYKTNIVHELHTFKNAFYQDGGLPEHRLRVPDSLIKKMQYILVCECVNVSLCVVLGVYYKI